MPTADLAIYPLRAPQIVNADGLRIREDVLYTDAKGQDHERSKKSAQGLLAKLREILPALMEPNETILYILRCQAPVGALEQLMLGWSVYQVTATTLVLTNLRILHLAMDSGGKWKRTLRTVRWGNVAEAKVKGWIGKQFFLKYVDGKKENYWRLRNKDARKARDLIAAAIPASRSEQTPARAMVALCPDCRTPLTARTYECQSCGLTFKDEKTLLRRTILVPGGGYWYTGIWILGFFSSFYEGIFTLGLAVELLVLAGLMAPEVEPGSSVPTRGEMLEIIVFLVVILALEKALQFIHSRRVVRTFLPLGRHR